MERREQTMSLVNAIAATIVVVLSLLLPPVVYALVAYTNLVAAMDAEEQIQGWSVNAAISAAPQLWTFQEARFTELLSRHSTSGQAADQLIRLVDNKGTLVAAVGEVPAWPIITRMIAVFDAGRPVGRLEIERSLRNLLLNAGMLSVLGLVLAAGSFVTLRVIPLRAMRKANAELQQQHASLAFANSVFAAAMEVSPDGIIVVDEHADILLCNRCFVDMWQIPDELPAAKADEPVLQSVTSRMRDPAAFLERTKYLYDHPEESSQDRIETKDGRVFDRRTTSLYDYDPERKYLGRIWFYREITEREKLQDELRNSEEKFRVLTSSAQDAIIMLDDAGCIVFWNEAARRMFGYSAQEALGQDAHSLVVPARYLDAFRAGWPRFAKDGQGPVIGKLLELNARRKDGGEFPIELSIAALRLNGHWHAIGVVRDITGRKQPEAART